MGTPGTRNMPKDFAHFESSTEAWARRIASGQAMNSMINAANRIGIAEVAGAVGRLDRPHRQGRAAVRAAAAAAGRRAQRGAHAVGLAPAHRLPARSDRHRPAQAHDQRQRQVLRLGREQHRLRADPRPGAPCGERGAASGARPEDAVASHRHDGAVSLLGRRADLGRADQQPQPDDGRAGPALVHGAHPSRREPGFLQEGLEPSVGEGVSARARHAAPLDVRSEERQVHADRHLLPDAPPDLRGGRRATRCGPRAAASAAASSAGSTARTFEKTGDEARSQGWTPFILDANGNGKRDAWVEPNQPLDPAKDKRVAHRHLLGRRESRRMARCGERRSRLSRAWSCASRRDPIPTHTALTEIYEVPFPGYGGARRRHRPRRQCSGCRSRAATSASSTGASARGRSTARRPRPAGTAPRAGSSTSCPVRSSGT